MVRTAQSSTGRRRATVMVTAAALAVGAAAVVPPPAFSSGGRTSRVSVSSAGAEMGQGNVPLPAISPDGRYVVFHTRATGLVPGDTNGADDVFIHDRTTGRTERVSVASDGTQGNAGSFFPDVSADGRYVAFGSGASNLVPGDTNGLFSPTTTTAVTGRDAFVHDRATGTTTRVSVKTGGGQAGCPNGTLCGGGVALSDVSISDDGRYVAFAGNATDLVPGDTNGATDVFVHDVATTTTVRVSVTSAGAQATGGGTQTAQGASLAPAISGSGRYVAFLSNATNLAPGGDTNGMTDVFVHDRDADGDGVFDEAGAIATTRDSVADDESEATGGTRTTGAALPRVMFRPAISPDGRFVAFGTDATNLVAGDSNAAFDVFVRDRQAGTTRRVSVTSGGGQIGVDSYYADVSGDGRFASFETPANGVVPGDDNGVSDTFVHDLATGATERVSVSTGGAQGDAGSYFAALSRTGRLVAFSSEASNLVPFDRNQGADVFVHDRQPGAVASRGYRLIASDGGVFSFGGAPFHGSTGDLTLVRPIVAAAGTPTGNGYWLVAGDGGVFAFGDAGFEGSTGSTRLNSPIVAMAPTPTGKGYWMVAADGGVFSFGDAGFHGSMGGKKLNQPIVGMAPTPTGGGYWMVARDGGIFAFGDARFEGSMGGTRLNQPIVGMAAAPSGSGYWMVARDGGIFAFGVSRFHGSTGGMPLNHPIVGMASSPSGRGYWTVGSDGGVFAFGDAAFSGSTGSMRLNRPVVAMTAAA